jgi:hypothetical protein
MPIKRPLYANTRELGFTSSFFEEAAPSAKFAFLACPFFTFYEPIKRLTDAKCHVRLLVRLCEITAPDALQQALNDERVRVRYFTSKDFHAKFYVVDDQALVGSANLTSDGMQKNREVSVVLRRDMDEAFQELTGLFEELWNTADVLNAEVLAHYKEAHQANRSASSDDAFDQHLSKYLDLCAPTTIRVSSSIKSRRRTFLQDFRQRYDEALLPAFREVLRHFVRDGRRRPELATGDLEIELSRFLGWVRVEHAAGETWSEQPLLSETDRSAKIEALLNEWHAARDIESGDMINVDREVENIAGLRDTLRDPDRLQSLSYAAIFQALTACHAFYEMLRFSAGGLPGLSADFAERNSLDKIKETLTYLVHGGGSSLERAYDCIFDPTYRLGRFGEACVMELLGWMDEERPPINGRTIKALRYLGFDVK